ncbi:MAG: transcription termination/antitermination protein NusA [Oscillospiraceae bacterium]|nr:transcription termination/antitermination protein NusA [Oscillospiraceae bacterium]
MNREFFEALELLEKEKGIPADYLLEKIENAIGIAVKRDYIGVETVIVNVDKNKETFEVAIRKTVVETVEDPANEIVPEEAVKIDKTAQVGDTVDILLQPKQFGRIAAQTAKHVIRQGIREAERGQMLRDFQNKEHDIVTALVTRIDTKKGIVTVEIDGSETILPKSEQMPGEELVEGDRIRVYVVEVAANERGPRIMISRTHPGLVKRLFEMEVPEIYDGTVEIKAVSREAGSRTKIAVYSKDENVDAIGSCIGPRGARVAKIVDELGGEKIDVVKYSEKPEEFISAALSPANVLSVVVDPEGAKSCKVTVPDGQLSLAIGNKGQNARLAAKLVGWKIDIRPESGFYGEDTED